MDFKTTYKTHSDYNLIRLTEHSLKKVVWVKNYILFKERPYLPQEDILIKIFWFKILL